MLKPAPELFIFAGPTLFGSDVQSQFGALAWLPPARRGDIEQLAGEFSPGAIALVDGVFHQSLAVGHAELRDAIAQGWRIWGLSSMGAIRAYEMRELGMRGVGEVYQYFLREDDFRDDEVALIHEAAPSYRPRSEPLVHIRVAIKEFIERKVLTIADADDIIAQLSSVWFGERTLTKLKHLLREKIGDAHLDMITDCVTNFQRYRIKTKDLQEFLASRCWQA
jgi:hypothetical protein